MASVSTYLNFQEKTEEAFNFYRSIFGGEFTGDIMRIGDAPAQDGAPTLSDSDKNLVMHVELKILGGLHSLMGTDCIGSMGMQAKAGNNMHINIDPGTRAETKRLFDGLSQGGEVTMELQDMFWGDYFGSFTDKFGINWMFNCGSKE